MSDRFELGTDLLSPIDRVYGDVANDGWDDLESEFEEFLTLYTLLFQDEKRKSFWDHERLDWSKHLEKLRHKGRFATKYRMSEKAFNLLVSDLGPILQADVSKAHVPSAIWSSE